MPGEDREALGALEERIREDLRPSGELESLLTDRIVSLVWRLRRVGKIEAGLLTLELRGARKELLFSMNPFSTDVPQRAEDFGNFTELASWGRAFQRDARDGDSLSKLSRYETTLSRGLFKALHELQRLQEARLEGKSASPPVAIDVDLSVSKGR